MGVGGQRHAPAALPPGMTRYPLYRRLGRPQGRSGRVLKISPPTGIRSPDRPARSESLYRLSYRGPHERYASIIIASHLCNMYEYIRCLVMSIEINFFTTTRNFIASNSTLLCYYHSFVIFAWKLHRIFQRRAVWYSNKTYEDANKTRYTATSKENHVIKRRRCRESM
jgi:hypothetical protein